MSLKNEVAGTAGMRTSMTGINTHRILQEVVGNNVANAANESYTRQESYLTEEASIWDGQNFLGQGVSVQHVSRVRDDLLDGQIREAISTQKGFEVQSNWLSKVEAVFNEPSETGISAALSKYWESWSELSQDPSSFATRSTVITRTENLTTLVQDLNDKLSQFIEDVDVEINRSLSAFNALTEEVAKLNKNIFKIEAGRTDQANGLHDQRDAALNKLSEFADVSYYVAGNGMINVSVGSHPAVIEDKSEELKSHQQPLDIKKLELIWEHGEVATSKLGGSLGGLVSVRDDLLSSYQQELGAFASDLIYEANSVYSKGVAMDGKSIMQSRLGYEALGVKSSTEALSLVSAGQDGSLHVSFYNSQKEVIRTASVIVDSTDTQQFPLGIFKRKVKA